VGPFQKSQIHIQWDVSENIQIQKNLMGQLEVSLIHISINMSRSNVDFKGREID